MRCHLKMKKNHPEFFLVIHDFSPLLPDPVEPPPPPIGAGDFGVVEKKRL